jgi:putative nucleotidyltransferase with HDIG domain
VSEAAAFLNALAQALSALALYPTGHASRERAIDSAFQHLLDLLALDPSPEFSFLGDEVVYGTRPLRELRDWDWGKRLSNVAIQRLQFDETATRSQLGDFLDETMARLTLKAIDTSEARQMRPSGIRFGVLGVRGSEEFKAEEIATAGMSYSLRDEAETIRWLHREVTDKNELPLVEAETVVRSLAVAMHGDEQMLMPLLKLRHYDEYTTTHSLNVSVLTMGLAEWMGLGDKDVRAFGIAGLLHDLGKVRIPYEVLHKTGTFTDEDRRIMGRHPAEGANIIITSATDLDLAAVVAYEHHIMINGGGYPSFRFKRKTHRASRLVHVCDVYDALRSDRPYRDAWPSAKVLAYIEERSGYEFDGEAAHAFTQMMREWEPQLVELDEDDRLPLIS